MNSARRPRQFILRWPGLTDPDIFEQLCQQAGSGIRVGLIVVNDSINRKGGLQYERLRDLGGIFMMIGDNKSRLVFMMIFFEGKNHILSDRYPIGLERL